MKKSKPNFSYAGIGSRRTPVEILALMEKIGESMARKSWILRSGNCCKADQAFQRGANSIDEKSVELFLPWSGYERQSVKPGNSLHLPGRQAFAIAAEYHPAWDKCSSGAKVLHARNVHIVLGASLERPVKFVVCWTPNGRETGGTALGIRVAHAYGVPVHNLALSGGVEFARGVLDLAGIGQAVGLPGEVRQSGSVLNGGGQMYFGF